MRRARRGALLRHAVFGLLLGAACFPSHAQDAGATDAAPVSVAQDAPPQDGTAARDDAPLPDPAYWIHDPVRPVYEWLNKPPIDAADLAARPEAYATTLATHGVALDLERRSVAVRGATLHDLRSLGYPIEYPVVTEIGKQHEALVVVRAQPSVIDACLKALGLVPGAPTALVEKDPLPPMDQIEAGEVSAYWLQPGYGPLVDIRVVWTDDDGRGHEESLESLFLDMDVGRALETKGWIYTGGSRGLYRQGSQRVDWFKADVEGDICAIYLEGLDVCLFERNSLDGLSYAPYTLNEERVPARQTPVTLHIVPRDAEAPRVERIDLGEFLDARDAAAARDRDAADDETRADSEGGDSAGPDAGHDAGEDGESANAGPAVDDDAGAAAEPPADG